MEPAGPADDVLPVPVAPGRPQPIATAAHAPPTHCENCGVVLHGRFCHACGQSIHSPLRHAGHAIEEVFESFWHLDGRIFRTLRELLVPGRVAIAYLAGHRARYVAPLRLFVILSVITFFVAQWSLQVPDNAVLVEPDAARPGTTVTTETVRAGRDAGLQAASAFKALTTIAAVEQARDAQLAELAKASRLVAANPVARGRTDAIAAGISEAAARRIAQLGGPAPTVPTPGSPVPADGVPDAAHSTTPAAGDPEMLWDAKENSVSASWLPAFANRWVNRQLERASRNAMRIRTSPQGYVHALISAVPSTLFVLVPVFALMLKLLYLFKRRLYLEHLVVALYSHAFLLMSLLVIFLSMLVRHQVPGWIGTALSWFEGLVWTCMPIYLLLMQKAVYRQRWPMTLAKYSVLALVYSVLLSFGAAATALVSLVRLQG